MFECCLHIYVHIAICVVSISANTGSALQLCVLFAAVCSRYGCQQLCVGDGEGKARCLCSEGYTLNPDQKTCKGMQQVITYVDTFVSLPQKLQTQECTLLIVVTFALFYTFMYIFMNTSYKLQITNSRYQKLWSCTGVKKHLFSFCISSNPL